MRVHSSLEAASSTGSIRGLALGFFDGVHPGHQAVFQAIQDTGHPLAILTFWPHPQAVLRPACHPALITGLEHKLHLFAQHGTQEVIVHPFDSAFARLEAADFLNLLWRSLPQLRAVACGPNFRFGRGRAGGPEMLAAACQKRGITIGLPPMAYAGGRPISSSRIRSVLTQGDLEQASRLLGRPYRLRGTVTPGRQLGYKLGFPTANVHSADGWLLPRGVYAGITRLPDGSPWPSAINLGSQPTIDPAPTPVVETHLIGFEGNLTGQVLEVEPRHWLRGQQRFSSLEELRAAIARDVARAAQISED